MAANKTIRFGPVALATSATDILNSNVTSMAGTVGLGTLGKPYLLIRHIRIVNKHASVAATFSLYIGATGGSAAGTEFMGTGTAVAVGSAVDWYGLLRMDSADFLSGLSNTATALTIEGEGEVGISG